MPHRTVPYPPSASSTSPHKLHSDLSPSRPVVSQLEVLYNTAVQSFVRRDHVRVQATLSRLLALLEKQKKVIQRPWYEVSGPSNGHLNGVEERRDEEWIIKTLKLVISSHTNLYSDPPDDSSALPEDMKKLLPPSPPDAVLDHCYEICITHFPQSSRKKALLPPQLISTFILASLKLRPAESALSFAHRLTEEWLAELPDEFVTVISGRQNNKDAARKKEAEGAREAYLKVVELFVRELLVREREWEMARGFLEGENVMSSKRKEVSKRSRARVFR